MHVDSRDYLEVGVKSIQNQINDAVRQVRSVENTCDGNCSVWQTVKEIQAEKFPPISSQFLLVLQTAK